MRQFALVTDTDLSRARQDTSFRQQLLTGILDSLLAELNKLRRAEPSPMRADQIREGAELAVRLADMLRQIAQAA